jgi:predicted tellurium resistance membrane protein TerC
MLKELESITRFLEAKINIEKQEVERKIAFLFLKGLIGIVVLTFLVITLFFWISNFFPKVEIAALVTALIFILAYILVSLIQGQLKKPVLCENNKNECLLIIIAAFIEGFTSVKRKKDKPEKDKS